VAAPEDEAEDESTQKAERAKDDEFHFEKLLLGREAHSAQRFQFLRAGARSTRTSSTAGLLFMCSSHVLKPFSVS
jgi:hypothetical protein